MRVGLVTTATDRGLGIQGWEFARHVDCEVLLVELADRRFASHRDRFPGARVAHYNRGLRPSDVRPFLERVDVVYSAETLFDPGFRSWADDAGVVSVVHANPEFWSGREAPHRVWSATEWRLSSLPAGAEVVPYPVATDRFEPVEPHERPCRWLHVAGKRALADRNGTDAVLAALPLLTEPCSITFTVQHGDDLRLPNVPGFVQVEVVGPQPDYWRLYDNHDALVLPRRYGGLCLPVQEAMAAGLAVVMTDISPNPRTWPVATVPAWEARTERMPAGQVPVAEIDVPVLAATIDSFVDPEKRGRMQAQSRAWAADNSWELWAPRYREMLAGVACRSAS